ncbi:MerR family transcriptional regulator [Rhodococcus sp. H29-C3]|uniref:MerR family transcriptional regulator n=1 Tax=Rhodococcus sp. H29-C3 TaxID=3046307 RepID=UPI0024BB235F|nr:MerR family transcriptional regulator [Rhodococcus sp. H29-C3]MDJ0362219.1 MerR family transcriptional regulator [Rhodococcus sp. H29-C3]
MVETGLMRIGQLAEVAGTTTRTVRHYHRLGLLNEPQRRSNGYRAYTVSDAVRLMRIRWLATNGVPLGSVAAILAEERSSEDDRDVEADLRSLIAGIEKEQAILVSHRAQLTAMLAEAERGNPISVLPAELAIALSDAIDTAPSVNVGSAIRRDRDLVEALSMSGKAPQVMLAGYEATMTDDLQRERYLALLAEWAHLEGCGPGLAESAIEALSARLLEFFDQQKMDVMESSAEVTEVAGGLGWTLSLDDLIPDPAQREVVLRVQRELSTRSSSTADI